MEKAGKDVSPSAAVLDGKVLSFKDVEALKDLPTKDELYAAIANRIKGVPTKIAKGVKQVPTKLARSISLVAELDDDKTKLVADMVGKGPGKSA